MTVTDELRRLLDERGVEYRWDNGTVTWFVDGVMYNAWGYDNERLTMSVCHFTPEQAIDATLGKGTCRRVRGHRSYRTQGGYRIECSECGYGLADRRYHYCPNCGRQIVEVSE